MRDDVDDLDPVPSDAYTSEPDSIPSSSEDRQLAMFAHLGGMFGFLIPLIIWLMKKDQSRFVDDQGKEAVNFHLTMMIGHFVGVASICLTFGIVNMVLWVLTLVFGILGGMAANKGEVYRYPLNFRFIK